MTGERLEIPAELLEQAHEEARSTGLTLTQDERGFFITDGTMSVRGDFTHMIPRIRAHAVNRELLVKAARIKGASEPLLIVDATAGLGEDSLLLAATGHFVTLYERNPVMAVLLMSAIAQARAIPDLADAAAHMKAFFADSVAALQNLDNTPDVVVLDPMFPERHKSAAVKKKLQIIQRIESPCEDEGTLLEAAFAARPRKVVVKRPAKGPHLAGRKPDYSLSGKAVRFDCYMLPR